MIPIGHFSQLTGLPAKTLRFYHTQDLLVPAQVDDETQYRSYSVDQIERAGKISVLRRAGMSLREVRELLADADLAPGALRRHEDMVRRQRQEQDQAIKEAWSSISSVPDVTTREAPSVSTVSTIVTSDPEDFEVQKADVAKVVSDLGERVEAHGIVIDGPWWKSLVRSDKDFAWRVTLPVDPTHASALPADVEFGTWQGRRESAVFLPGAETLGMLTIAVSRMIASGRGDVRRRGRSAADLPRRRHGVRRRSASGGRRGRDMTHHGAVR